MDKELKAYRDKLFTDLYTNVIPDRVPIQDTFTLEYFIEYAGKDLLEAQYSIDKPLFDEIIPPVMEFARGDSLSLASARNAPGLMFQRSITNVMGKTGTIQHPEVSVLPEEEYDQYIENPYDFSLAVLDRRKNLGYDEDPVTSAMNRLKYVFSQMDDSAAVAYGNAKLVEDYSLYSGPKGVGGRQPVPLDTLADMNRGFSNITKDIKRCPQKVLDAIEALMPYCIYKGKTKVHPLSANSTMTHMAAFLRTSEFEKFYWESFNKLVHISAERGQHQLMFCEHDWTRFVDHMQELPQGTRIFMEYGDPKYFKDKLGKNCVLGGFYPLTLLKNGTKEQCVDKAKELLDIMAPGGNYYFRTDKSTIGAGDLKVENYVAVMDYVLENTKYENAGEPVTTVPREDTIQKGLAEGYPEFKSKYIVSFDDYIKQFPPVDERVTELMRARYEKYSRMAEAYFN